MSKIRPCGFAVLLVLVSSCSGLPTHGDLPTVHTLPPRHGSPKVITLRVFHIETNQPFYVSENSKKISFLPDVEIQKTISNAFVKSDYFSRVSLVSSKLRRIDSDTPFISVLISESPADPQSDLVVTIQWHADRGFGNVLDVLFAPWQWISFLSVGLVPVVVRNRFTMYVEVADRNGRLLDSFTVKNALNLWGSTLFIPISGAIPALEIPTDSSAHGFFKNTADAILIRLDNDHVL